MNDAKYIGMDVHTATISAAVAPMRSSIFGPDTRTHPSQNATRNCLERGYTSWNGPSGFGLDARFLARLAHLAYSEWCRMQRKSLIYLVDETGVEPATSSLRRMRPASRSSSISCACSSR
jgi:hypothetical protein